MGKKYAVKGDLNPSGGGTIISRHISTKPSAQQLNTGGSPTLPNVGEGIGAGTRTSRYSSTKPTADSGQKGPAQPLTTIGSKDPLAKAGLLGARVYKSAKPSKR